MTRPQTHDESPECSTSQLARDSRVLQRMVEMSRKYSTCPVCTGKGQCQTCKFGELDPKRDVLSAEVPALRRM